MLGVMDVIHKPSPDAFLIRENERKPYEPYKRACTLVRGRFVGMLCGPSWPYLGQNEIGNIDNAIPSC